MLLQLSVLGELSEQSTSLRALRGPSAFPDGEPKLPPLTIIIPPALRMGWRLEKYILSYVYYTAHISGIRA